MNRPNLNACGCLDECFCEEEDERGDEPRTVPCRSCAKPTWYIESALCDRCWHLEYTAELDELFWQIGEMKHVG
jgi:hypothetical protein